LARGHENILATHETTLEITKEAHLSKKGDCIIAVGANKAIDDLSIRFKEILRKDGARLTILVQAGEATETINACGDSQLILAHPTDIVVRKTDYICNRTLAIQADKSACELSRKLVRKLRNPEQEVKITLTVKA
jgi:hypothetical protein